MGYSGTTAWKALSVGMDMALILETPQALKDLVGREVAVTDWSTISQERIRQFAEITDDRQWIHVDEERAQRESPFRGTIAHGFLTLSLLSSFMRQAVEIRLGVRMSVNYGLNRVRFPAPVPSGAQIRAHFTLQSLKQVAGALEAAFGVTIEIEHGDKPCCVAEWVVRYYE